MGKALNKWDNSRLRPLFNPRTMRHWRLLTARFQAGLLTPFICSSCKLVVLDPFGWNGRRRPLCERCADGEGANAGGN
jgi:hypothetical protein